MTSKAAADKATPRGAVAAAVLTEPPELAVLIVQFEALEHDETIRRELKSKGFVVKQQALITLSNEDAREFVLEVCNPYSERYRSTEPVGENQDNGAVEQPVPSQPLDSSPRESVEAMENSIAALTRGPALVLGLEKPRAIADLQQLVGPASGPDLVWAAAASGNDSSTLSFRSRFGKSCERVGLRCTEHSSTAASELAYLTSRASGSGGGHHKPNSSGSKVRHSSSTTGKMHLDQLLGFLFPPHQQHPNSAGRLFVFALYGPLDAKSRLHSGEKGLHVVTDGELATMSKRMEREDILAVYDMCSLSQEDEEEVVRQVDQMLKSFPQYTPRDITALFASLPRDTDGCMSFHDMQRVVIKERCRRVLCMKEKLHPQLAPSVQNAFRFTLTRLMKTRSEVAPASFFLKDVGATGAENATLVTRLLSNHTFQIAHFGDGNSPELTQNVRLLRDDFRRAEETRERWNPN